MDFKKVASIVIALIIILIGAIIFLRFENDRNSKTVSDKREISKYKPSEEPSLVFPKTTPSEKKQAHSLPKLVIVIDDIGNSKELGDEVLSIKNVTIAIIPNLKYSLYFAQKGKDFGKDILVHVPMEPKDSSKYDSDSEILKVGMSESEIKKLADKLLNAVPYAIGANNHMGSKFTEDTEKIESFLQVLKKRNMFFVDSRTSTDSKAYETTLKLGIKGLKRDIFLDHEITEEKISEQLDKAVDIAIQNGYAIAIGHPHKETIKVLKTRLEEISKKVNIVSISHLKGL